MKKKKKSHFEEQIHCFNGTELQKIQIKRMYKRKSQIQIPGVCTKRLKIMFPTHKFNWAFGSNHKSTKSDLGTLHAKG
jgi:hypothetical protein